MPDLLVFLFEKDQPSHYYDSYYQKEFIQLYKRPVDKAGDIISLVDTIGRFDIQRPYKAICLTRTPGNYQDNEIPLDEPLTKDDKILSVVIQYTVNPYKSGKLKK